MMRRNLTTLWSVFVVVAAASAPEAFAAPLPAVVESVAPGITSSQLSAAVDWSSLEPPPPVRYLLLGDSMAWALGTQLQPLLTEGGDKLVMESKISGSIRGFGRRKAKKIREPIAKYRPDAVIIVLGSNEALIPYPRHLEKPIRRIVEAVGARKCYWVGPPMWREDTGVVDVLRDHTGPCEFFDSSGLDLERRPDKIHPTRGGSTTWALAVRDWLQVFRTRADR